MPTVAAIGAVVSAGAGVASAIGNSKAQKKAAAQQAALAKSAAGNAEGIFGSTPEFSFEEYTPLEEEDPGFMNIVRRVLQGDQANLPYATALSGDINKAISKATRQRIEGWDPSFMGALSTLQKTRNQTLKGRLPYEDALAISADRGRLANDLGQAGGSGGQTAADLGLKRLDLMTSVGPNLTASIVNILQGVDPINRHSVPQDYLLSPTQGVGLAIQDRQFGSQFNMTGQLTQSYLDAAPDPAAQGMFNLQAFQAGFGGGGSNNNAQMIGAVGNAFSSLAGINWGGMFDGAGAASKAAAPSTQYIGNNGYVPYNPASAYNPGGSASTAWAMGA